MEKLRIELEERKIVIADMNQKASRELEEKNTKVSRTVAH
jgi:hypothetical protein